MRTRYKYGLAGLVLGVVSALAAALPVLVAGQFALKADHSAKAMVSIVSWAVLAFFAAFPPAAGYALGRKKELGSAPAAPAEAGRWPSILQVVLGGVIAVFSAAFAYAGGAAGMILAVFVLPQGLMRRFDAMPAVVHECVFLAYIAVVVLAGWGGYRIGSSLGDRSR